MLEILNPTTFLLDPLILDYNNYNKDKVVVNTIIVNTKTDNIRVYPGFFNLIHQLETEPHRLILLYTDNTYQVIDDIQLKPNGVNVVQIKAPEAYLNDFFSQAINDIINTYGLKVYSEINQKRLNSFIKQTYRNNHQYFGPGYIIKGNVVDNNELPLPSVFIQIKGTDMGTTTDFDGNFTLKVPNKNSVIIYTYVGYKTLEKRAETYNDVKLEEDVAALKEVVVVGYGSTTKMKSTMAVVSSVDSGFQNNSYIENIPVNEFVKRLQGQVAGLGVNSLNGQPGSNSTIILRGTGSISGNLQPLYILDGVPIEEDQFAKLSQEEIKNVSILKDAVATAIYGNRGASGVIIVNTRSENPDLIQEGEPNIADVFMAQNEKASSIRTNFSDVAYWQPTLRTDENGEVQFVVTYPDDITSWQNVVLAMNGKRQSGRYMSFTNSYKPVSARLFVPKFLTEGDNLTAIGKTFNYTQDTIGIETKFSIGEKTVFTKQHKSMNALIDTLDVLATKDTLQLTYQLNQKNSDYFDGEKRNIPIFKKGVELQKGLFKILEPGDTLTHTFDVDGPVQFYAEANAIDLIERDIKTIVNYRYECNEQLASKLKMLLLQKRTDSLLNRDFSQEKDIKKIVRKLTKNRIDNGLWGWWKSSAQVSDWISLHVIEALLLAEENRYSTGLKQKEIGVYLKNRFVEASSIYSKAQLLYMLSMLGEKPYPDQLIDIKLLLSDPSLNLHTRLKLSLALQQLGLKPDINFLKSYERTTVFGSIYIDDYNSNNRYRVYQNSNLNTLMAYKLIRNQNMDDDRLAGIRTYLLESKQSARNLNTYETTRILETILPDILNPNTTESPKAKLTVNGQSAEVFPYKQELTNPSLVLMNTGNFPVYITAYQSYWETNPKRTTKEFEVNSYFKEKPKMSIENGEDVRLKVDVKVKKKAEYIMLEIPIPAGFDYTSKPVNKKLEDHREYFKDRVSIFSSGLDEGVYTFEIPLMAKYSGSYNLNPAKIELMYFPTHHAHEGLKRVEVE